MTDVTKPTLYLITVAGGEYDDAWSYGELVTDDLKAAEAYIVQQELARDNAVLNRDEIAAYMDSWVLLNAPPKIIAAEEIAIKTWIGIRNADITAEMRTERAAAKSANAAATERAYVPHRDWLARHAVERTKFIAKTFTEQKLSDMKKLSEDSHWIVEQINWLK